MLGYVQPSVPRDRGWAKLERYDRFCALVGVVIISVGCSTARLPAPAWEATKQFLTSQAAVKAVAQLSFEALKGRKVYVDPTYFASIQREFILGEIRAKCLRDGLQLVPRREDAQVIMEVRSGAVGIDRSDFLVGLPPLLVDTEAKGSGAASSVPLQTPELALMKKIDQKGFASVAYVAYWAKTGEVVASSGPFVGRARREDWWFFGFGSRIVGDIPTVMKPSPRVHTDESGQATSPADSDDTAPTTQTADNVKSAQNAQAINGH